MTAPPGAGPSFLRPRETPRPTAAISAVSLPPDLAAQSVDRLRILAFLYAAIYFLVGVAPAFLVPELFAEYTRDIGHWVPSVISIMFGVATGVYARRLTPERAGLVATLFVVVSSYGIAFGQYHDVTSGILYHGQFGGFGLSWVAPWVLLFIIAVPAPPRRAALGATGAASAPAVVFALETWWGQNTVALTGGEFFFSLVFPYAFIVLMAWFGSRIIYRLGVEVKQARELGSYRLVERLGQGGMGEVWRASHRLLARPAAVKLINPEMLGVMGTDRHRELTARFEREAQATAAMRCPHTVELYDFGTTDDGSFYYVMELLDGLDAEALVRNFGPLPAERVVYLLRQVCHSLSEAHELGLIHRDIKPANVFVSRYGREHDWVKVLDFGLVKADIDPADRDVKLTGDRPVGGTPAYMAPEQVLGDHPVDARADLYAVGCVAYWLLTGQVVFEGRTAIETMLQHVETAPVPPSRRTELAVPESLDRIVLRCLEKDPANRPPSADALSVALGDVPLAQRWTAERARQWWDVHRPAAPRRRSST